MLKLSDSDLRFVVQTVATSRRDHDHIVNLIRDKEDLIEPMLEDPKLLERLFQDDETLVRVSPHLLFSVLLRRVTGIGKGDLCSRAGLERETDPGL